MQDVPPQTLLSQTHIWIFFPRLWGADGSGSEWNEAQAPRELSHKLRCIRSGSRFANTLNSVTLGRRFAEHLDSMRESKVESLRDRQETFFQNSCVTVSLWEMLKVFMVFEFALNFVFSLFFFLFFFFLLHLQPKKLLCS